MEIPEYYCLQNMILCETTLLWFHNSLFGFSSFFKIQNADEHKVDLHLML